MRTSAGTPIGKVRIGSLPSTAHPLVSTLYKRLKERYPLIQLAVREGQGAQLETWLEDGSVDLAILYRTSHVTEEWRYLSRRDIDLSRQRGRRSADVAADGALFERCTICRSCCSAARAVGAITSKQISAERKVSLNVALEADSLSLQTHIVSEGGVYALLGPYAVAAASKDRRLQSSKLVDPGRHAPHRARDVASWQA